MKKLKIKKEEDIGMRFDKFLTKELKERTRSQIQKDIEKGLFVVEGEVKSSHYKLKEGEVVSSGKIKEIKKIESVEKKKKVAKFKLVFENDEFLIVNKPAGLIVHKAAHIEEETLADQLVLKYPELKKVGEDVMRPGIVHRLDKDASGLMVVARNNKAFKNLKRQFQNRTVLKEYKALVFGKIKKDEDKIDFSIKRSSAGNKQAAVPSSFKDTKKQTREAITFFVVEKEYINYTFLKVKIKTGRKHQIRVHMTAYGYPIVGDDLYGTQKTKGYNNKIKLNRIFLVASLLSFDNLKGEKEKFKIDLPIDLKNFLKEVK